MPRERRNFLGTLSRILVTVAIARPLVTIGIGLLTAAVAIYCGINFIQIHTSRADLLNSKNEYHRRWLAYVNEFSDKEDVYVVVEGDNPNAVAPALIELAEALRREPQYFTSVLERVDKTPLKRKGLYYLSTQELQQIVSHVRQLKNTLTQLAPVLRPANVCLEAAAMISQIPPGYPSHQAFGQIAQVIQYLAVVLNSPPEQLAETILTQIAANNQQGDFAFGQGLGVLLDPEKTTDLREEMFFSHDGHLGLVILRFTPDRSGQFTRFAAHIRRLREITSDVNRRYPNLRIGSTGLPILEYDEMRASSSSAMVAVLSLAGVILVFFAGFGGIRYPVAVTFSLVTGVCWAVGFVVIAVGHLNILTSAFGAMLIGLGDYGVHFVAHYLDRKKRQPNVRDTLIETAETVGPGIATGAVTTAVAFFAGAFTDFLGVAELGIIAGGGILLCWLADMTILPAFLCLIDRDGLRSQKSALLDLTPWFRPIAHFPKAVTLGVGAVVTLLAMGLPHLRYDYNLLHLQPKGLESVEYQNKLVEHMSRGSYFALSIAANPEEAKRRKAEFLKLPTVDHVEDLVSVLPDDVAVKRTLITQLAAELKDWSCLDTNIPSREVLDQGLAGLQMALQHQPHAESAQLQMIVNHLRTTIRSLPAEEYTRRLSYLTQTIQREILPAFASLALLTQQLDPPQLDDLPQPLVERFVGKNGRHLLQVYCKGDFWDPVTMRQFVADIRSVDPAATGNPIQIYEACHQMNRAYIEAAIYAFVAILLTLYLDFRSIKDVLLSLLPLILGMISLFGLMGWFDLPLNPANMITLPLILGIGIDDGVHILHDFRRQGNRYRMPEGATLTAVTINSLTTLVGFGALMASPHCGLESLGRVLTFGMAFCLVTALLMPGFLRWASGLLRVDRDSTEWETKLQEILKGVTAGQHPTSEPHQAATNPPRVVAPLSAAEEQPQSEQSQRAAISVKIRPRRAA
ncbi:MAG TPA: MMPL family transporter [Thermogutta sp.]|mgnify:CR=1 FL=1|nr:MMPL family transporter [Thermogutta sp.]